MQKVSTYFKMAQHFCAHHPWLPIFIQLSASQPQRFAACMSFPFTSNRMQSIVLTTLDVIFLYIKTCYPKYSGPIIQTLYLCIFFLSLCLSLEHYDSHSPEAVCFFPSKVMLGFFVLFSFLCKFISLDLVSFVKFVRKCKCKSLSYSRIRDL